MNTSQLSKHTLYIINIADFCAILIAFLSAFLTRFEILSDLPFKVYLLDYAPLLLISLSIYLFLNIFYLRRHLTLLKNNLLHELLAAFKLSFLIVSLSIVYLNFTKTSDKYSRIFELFFFFYLFLYFFLFRSLTRKHLRNSGSFFALVEKVIILVDEHNIASFMQKANLDNDWRYEIIGLVTLKKSPLKEIAGYPILGSLSQGKKIFKDFTYDGIILAFNDEIKCQKLIAYFTSLGKVVYYRLNIFSFSDYYRKFEYIGDWGAVCFRAFKTLGTKALVFKRFLDIVVSLTLLPLFVAVWLLLKISYLLKPTIVMRTRVGKNNVLFQRYYFRVYRLDAEKRLAQKKSPFTFIGYLLVKSHLDSLPAILNVLGGTMSLVGPKAVNLSTYLTFNEQEKNLLLFTPGLVGIWANHKQTSKDKLLNEQSCYGENWSVIKDIIIIIKLVIRYLTARSYREDGRQHWLEEETFIQQINRDKANFVYENNYQEIKNIKQTFYFFSKRLFDIIFASLALLILALPMLIITCLIVFSDGGKPFYGHERIGKNGRLIKIYKFRSMCIDAGDVKKFLNSKQLAQYYKEFKVVNDPRITKIGSFLRKTSLDELPQLFNILMGQLSIVGPRPIVKEETKQYGKQLAKLLSVVPGLTGYWQAYGRSNIGYQDGRRQQMELYYVDNKSLFFDLKIIIHTFIAVLKQDGAE